MNFFSQSLTRRDNNGNNILHVCARLNRVECLKLVLRVQPDAVRHENAHAQTPLDIAEKLGHNLCVELVRNHSCFTSTVCTLRTFVLFFFILFSMQMKHALQGKTELFQNVVVDWMWIGDDQSFDDVDFSDDDIVDRCQVLKRQKPCKSYNISMRVSMFLLGFRRLISCGLVILGRTVW